MPNRAGKPRPRPARRPGPEPTPAYVYAGSVIIDTQGAGAVVNMRNEIIVLTLDHDASRRYTVAQARKLALELWNAAEFLEVAEGAPPPERPARPVRRTRPRSTFDGG